MRKKFQFDPHRRHPDWEEAEGEARSVDVWSGGKENGGKRRRRGKKWIRGIIFGFILKCEENEKDERPRVMHGSAKTS